jgi:hypothetical protein
MREPPLIRKVERGAALDVGIPGPEMIIPERGWERCVSFECLKEEPEGLGQYVVVER